ncbi:MAG: sialate O-acetylesterase, partial [Rubripirellula sp.]
MIRSILLLFLTAVVSQQCRAELKFSPIFGDSMVLQREQPIHIWGWTTPNTEVTAKIAGKAGATTSDESGRFDLLLDPLPAGGPHELKIAADETKTFQDVLVGEVWLCSGQSNMAWPVSSANDSDLESLTANYPNLRLISVPQTASQVPLNDFEGQWAPCTPETVRSFSAVGYFYGRQLHQTLDVPVGLIDNAWGGSAAEAWVAREDLEQTGRYQDLLHKWDETVASYDHSAEMEKYQRRLEKWQAEKKGARPRAPLSRARCRTLMSKAKSWRAWLHAWCLNSTL